MKIIQHPVTACVGIKEGRTNTFYDNDIFLFFLKEIFHGECVKYHFGASRFQNVLGEDAPYKLAPPALVCKLPHLNRGAAVPVKLSSNFKMIAMDWLAGPLCCVLLHELVELYFNNCWKRK